MRIIILDPTAADLSNMQAYPQSQNGPGVEGVDLTIHRGGTIKSAEEMKELVRD